MLCLSKPPALLPLPAPSCHALTTARYLFCHLTVLAPKSTALSPPCRPSPPSPPSGPPSFHGLSLLLPTALLFPLLSHPPSFLRSSSFFFSFSSSLLLLLLLFVILNLQPQPLFFDLISSSTSSLLFARRYHHHHSLPPTLLPTSFLSSHLDLAFTLDSLSRLRLSGLLLRYSSHSLLPTVDSP